ncbi:MAG: dihydroxy-acid dehydratase [Opitutales bacterium]|jgi:dihydroxy-acid dehydratase
MSSENRPHSSVIVDGDDRAAARAMLRAVGFNDEDFRKPQIGVASTWSNLTPCNTHIDELARHAGKGVAQAGGKPVTFNTITVSDGISMGTQGMRYSLVSREVIADSIETVVSAEGFDGVVAIGGCDKNMPGCVMAMARLNRPAVFVYGGTILPGIYNDRPADIVTVYEAIGKHAAGKITDEQLRDEEKCAIPGPGSCSGMYTANTMASAIEVMGMSLPGSSAQLAVSKDKRLDCENAGAAVLNLLAKNIRPRDIITRDSLLNAITVCMALGGSTNLILHLLAIAHCADVKLTLDDFDKLSHEVPLLADVMPFGRYNMSHLIRIGGIQPMIKMLLDRGMLKGDCMTVTGRTLAENVKDVPPYSSYPDKQDIIHPFDKPIKSQSHLRVLRGNLAPDGAVGKITGREGLYFKGSARVYEGEDKALKGILHGDILKGDVIVIRNEGPVGGPGMREMLAPTSTLAGRGLINDVALLTDGRFSGGSHGFDVAHITPEAALGGPIAIVRDGDEIEIDAVKNTISLNIPQEDFDARMKALKPTGPGETRGVLGKYAALVSSASEGAVTDKCLRRK